MADNFNFKQFLVENKLGAYSKTRLSEGIEDYDIKGMQADMDAMPKGDEDDAEYIEPESTSIQIKNPRDAKEVAAAIKQLQKQGSQDVSATVLKAMQAAYEAEGKSPQQAKVAARMLLNGSTDPDFRQNLIDALAGDGLEEDVDEIDEYSNDPIGTGAFQNDENEYSIPYNKAKELWNMYAKNNTTIGTFAQQLIKLGVPEEAAMKVAFEYDDLFSAQQSKQQSKFRRFR